MLNMVKHSTRIFDITLTSYKYKVKKVDDRNPWFDDLDLPDKSIS